MAKMDQYGKVRFDTLAGGFEVRTSTKNGNTPNHEKITVYISTFTSSGGNSDYETKMEYKVDDIEEELPDYDCAIKNELADAMDRFESEYNDILKRHGLVPRKRFGR